MKFVNMKSFKKIMIALICLVVAVASGFVLVNANRTSTKFDPSIYDSEWNSSNQYDSSTYGKPGQGDNNVDDLKNNKDSNDAGALKNKQDNENPLVNNQNGPIVTNATSGVVGDANSGLNGTAQSGGGSGITNNNGGNGGNGSGGSGGTGGNTNPNPNTITISGDPLGEVGGRDPNRMTYYNYVSLNIEMDTPTYYVNQIVLMDEVRPLMTKCIETLENADTREKSYHDVTDKVNFYFDKDDNGNKIIKNFFDAQYSEGSSTSGSVKIIYERSATGSSSETQQTYVMNYNLVKYGVDIYDSDGQPLFEDSLTTNKQFYDLKNAYNKFIEKHSEDGTYIDNDTNVLKKLFLGWYITDKTSLSTIDLGVEAGLKELYPLDLVDIPDGYTIKLDENNQQTFTSYDGNESTIAIPNGVTTIKVDKDNQNDKITTIKIPASVTDIDFESLISAYPNLSAYEVDNDSTIFSSENGVLYSKDKTEIINVPNKYWKNNSSGLIINENVEKINENAFLGTDGKNITLNIKNVNASKIEGMSNIPDNSEVIVKSTDDDIVYLRYMAALNEQNIKLTTNKLVNEYEFKDGLIFVKDTNKLAYIPYDKDKSYVSYTVNDDATVITKTTFDAIKDKVVSLTIPNSVKKIESNALKGFELLETLVVNDANQTIIEDSIFGDSTLNSGLMVYLPTINHSDASYGDWLAQLNASFDDEGQKHISFDKIYINPKDGATYIIDALDATKYTLVSVPKSATVYDPLENENQHVIAIDKEAFKDCNKLIEINIPSDVVSIADDAFVGCTSLEILYFNSFTDPSGAYKDTLKDQDSIKIIGNASTIYKANNSVYYSIDKKTLLAVASNYKDDTLKLEDKTTEIGNKAVKSCKKIESVIVPSGIINHIGDYAFSDCAELNKMPINEDGTSIVAYQTIGSYAFINSKITDLVLNGEEKLIIGDYAFKSIATLNSVKLYGNIASLGIGVFSDNTSLLKVQVGNSLTSLNSKQKLVNYSILRSNEIDLESVTDTIMESTGEATFAGCTSLDTVTLNSTIKTIGKYCFDGCTKLRNVAWAEDTMDYLEVIDDRAFNNCENYSFSGYFIPFHNLDRIGKYAYHNCFIKTDDISKSLSIQIGRKVSIIDEGAFSIDMGKKSSILSFVPDAMNECALTFIGDDAFKNVDSLEMVNFQKVGHKKNSSGQLLVKIDGVEIGNSAFENCKNLSLVYWGTNRIASIGESCFAGDIKLSDADMLQQDNLLSIGNSAFAGCSSIEVADFSRTKLATVSENLFGTYEQLDNDNNIVGCDSLNHITLSMNTNVIESKAFVGAYSLSQLDILYVDGENNIINPPVDIFYKKDSSTLNGLQINVPSSEGNVLYELYKEKWGTLLTLEGIFYDDIVASSYDESTKYYNGGTYSIKEDGTYRLDTMDKGKEYGVSLLSNITEIADGAFKDCINMTEVEIPSTVTTFGTNIFEGCTKLEAIVFQGKDGVQVKGSLFGNTDYNENLRLIIPTTAAANYYAVEQLKQFKMIASGDSFWSDDSNGAVYAKYTSSSDIAQSGYIWQLLYVPKTFSKELKLISQTNYIYKEALRGSQIQTVECIGSNLVSIGDYAFADCKALTYVDLQGYRPTSYLTHIGNSAFENCSSLNKWAAGSDDTKKVNNISIDSISTMGTAVFRGCSSIAGFIWTTKNLSAIPDSTFENCTSLTKPGFGESLIDYDKPITSFGKRCFAGCISFTSVGGSLAAFGGLTSIGDECYDGCENMTLLILPKTVTNIGHNSLRGCTSLEVLAMSTETPLSLKNAGISDETWASLGTYVPTGKKQAYLDTWAQEGVSAPLSINDSSGNYRSISGNVYGCDNAAWNYYGCSYGGQEYHTGLIFAGVTSGSYKVESDRVVVSIYNSTRYIVTEIGAGALEGNTKLANFRGALNNKTCYITKIGDNAFKDCKNLIEADFVSYYSSIKYDALTTIGNNAFSGCESLPTYVVGSNVSSIGSRAFEGTKDGFILDMTKIQYPTSVTLGEKIFGDNLDKGPFIQVQSDTIKTQCISAWGEQLKAEYKLNNEQLSALFKPSITTSSLMAMDLNIEDYVDVDDKSNYEGEKTEQNPQINKDISDDVTEDVNKQIMAEITTSIQSVEVASPFVTQEIKQN